MAIDLKIELEDEQTYYTPGMQIKGRILWTPDQSPKEIVGCLGWQTHGKGDKDSEVLVEQRWTPLPGVNFVKFSWTIPRAPLSLSGSIINIQWFVEAEAVKPNGETSRMIQIGYSAQPIRLQTVI